MTSSFELLSALEKLRLFDWSTYPRWWPDEDPFRILVEVILTQQSRWEKVQESVGHMERLGMLSLEGLLATEQWRLASAIVPSGFYNQKAQRLIAICRNILENFGSLETFMDEVSRDWLLRQKGIGPESADSILCYMLGREAMVVDNYTLRLLEAFGYTFESYDDVQAWLLEGIDGNMETILAWPGYDDPATVYARFHGLIVEYGKRHSKKSRMDITLLEEL